MGHRRWATATAVVAGGGTLAAAIVLLTALSALTRSEATFQRIRDDLFALGIPDDDLPRTLAEQRARQMPTGTETTVPS